MKKIALGLLLLSTSAYADRLFYSHDIVTNIHGDYVGGAYLKYKLVWGDDGVANDVSASNPLPVQFSGGIGGITVNQGTTPWVVFDQTLDSDLISFRTANHSDLTLIDSDLLSFKSANHTDLLSVISSIGTGNSSLSSIDSTLTSLNGKVTTTANGIKVDGSAVTQPVSGSVSVSNFPATQPVSGTVTANQGTAGAIAWPVDGSGVTQPVSGTVTANAGTGNFTVVQPTGSNLHVNVDSAPTTSVTQGTSPWVVSGTVTANQGSPPWSVSQSGTWTTGRTWTLLNTTDSVNAVQSGVWSTGRTWNLSSGSDSVNVGNFPATQAVTQSTSPWGVSGTVTSNIGTTGGLALDATLSTTLPRNVSQIGGNAINTGTGASGTGTQRVAVASDSNVLATQSGSWTTGRTWSLLNSTDSVNAVQSGAWSTGRTWTLSSGTDSIAATQSGTWTVQQGSAPWSVSQSGTWNVGLNAGSNIVGNFRIDQTTPGTTNAVQANAGTNLNTSLLSLQSGANMMLDRSGTGNITAACVTPASCAAGTTVTALSNGSSTVNFTLTNTWVGTVIFEGLDGNATWQSTIGTVPGNGSPTASSGTPINLSIPSGGFSQIRARCTAYVSGTITAAYNVGSGLSTLQVFNLTPSAFQMTANAGTNLNTSALALSATQTSGAQKTQVVDASGNVQPSGDTVGRKIFTATTDGTNTQAVKAASTAPASTDPSAVVSVSSNFANLTGTTGTAVSVGVASTATVTSNANRAGLILVNTSTARESCTVGTAVLNSGITLFPGGVWTMDQYTFTTAAINCIAGAAASNISVQEFTK